MQPAATCLGVKVPFSKNLTPTRIERLNSGQYEGQEIAGVLEVVNEQDRVLEMGAGLGVVGAVAALNGKPEAVLSFEGNPELIDDIRALYDLNTLSDRISVRNEILLSSPNRPETISFHIQNSFLGSGLTAKKGRKTREVTVPTSSFETVRNDFSPTILVVDIEGGELELLRHADLEGIRAVVIEFHPAVYGTDGMKECKNLLRDAGFVKLDKVSSRLVWTCVRKQPGADQAPDPEGGWSTETAVLDNAIVVPPTESSFVQEAGVLSSDGSYCDAGAFWRNTRALTIAPDKPTEVAESLPGKWLWGGVMWMHFGHFLVESTNRLWGLDTTDNLDGILYIPKRPRVGEKLVSYQTDFFKLLGIDLPIKVVTEPTTVEQLVVPGQGFGLGKIVEGTAACRKFIAERFGRDVEPSGSEKLYISRSRIGLKKGALIGEERLEDYLREDGYEIFHPEIHDMKTQIERYKAAKHIVAAEGSALHLFAMVARADQKVAIVARRRSGATVQIEKHLQSFADITPMTFDHIVRSWMPHGKSRKRMALGEIDMPALQSSLINNGFISNKGAKWASLSDSEVADMLGDRFVEFND